MYIRWYLTPNGNFKYDYPHSNVLFNFCTSKQGVCHKTLAAWVSDVKLLGWPITNHIAHDIRFPMVYRRTNCHKILTLSSQKSRYIIKCIRILIHIWATSWENRFFAYAKTKMQISFTVTAKLISAFVFATRIVQSLYFLNPKFQVSSHSL